MCAHARVCTHTLRLLRGPRGSDTPGHDEHSNTQMFVNTDLSAGLGEVADSRLRLVKHTMKLAHLTVPEVKECSVDADNRPNDTGTRVRGPSAAKSGTIWASK